MGKFRPEVRVKKHSFSPLVNLGLQTPPPGDDKWILKFLSLGNIARRINC